MCSWRFLPVALVCVCFCIPVLGQATISKEGQAVAVQRDPQAMALLAQCSAAMGAGATVPDLYLAGTITPANPDSPPSTFVLESKGIDRVRNEIGSPKGKEVFVVNNERGFSLVSDKRESLALHLTSYFRPEHLNAFACSIDVARPEMSVIYAGDETVGNSTSHHIVFRAASPNPLDAIVSEFDVYIDSKTLRVIKTAIWAFAPDAIENRSKWETYYDEYQSVGGVLVPTHMTHFLAGKKFDEWSVASIRTDVAIAEGDFQ